MNADSAVILAGGKEILALLTDGSTETVKVRCLAVREFPKWLEILDDEPARIEFVCSRDKGWADKLTQHTHEEIVAVMEELNDPGFFAWLRRRVVRQERLAPGSSGELGKALLSASPTGSQTAQSAAE